MTAEQPTATREPAMAEEPADRFRESVLTRVAAGPVGRLLDMSPPAYVVTVMFLAYVVIFGSLTWQQQSNFGTFGFDLGVYDQVVWLLSRFEDPFITIRGLNLFGFHVNIVLFLFVPLYWLGMGAHALLLVQTVWMALGAMPVYLIGRDRLASPWLATALAACFLLFPSLQWINWWHFHPDALIITPLLFAWWFAGRGRWRAFAIAVGLALLCKEDAALAVFFLGLIVAKRWDRRVGLWTAAAAAVWFTACTRLILPNGNGVGPFYEDLFPGFGNSSTEIAWNMIRHPSRWYELAVEGRRQTYYWQMLAPVAFLPLAALPILIAAPQTLVNVISGHSYTHEFRYHYSSILIAAIFIALIETVARRGRKRERQFFLVGVVVAASLASNIVWSPSPIGAAYDSGIWAKAQPRHETVKEALNVVPGDEGLSAIYYLVPHVAQRVHIYEWPNPWIVTNWSVRGVNPPDPDDVDWLLLDRTVLDPAGQALFERLQSEGWRVVFDRDGIVVATVLSPAEVRR